MTPKNLSTDQKLDLILEKVVAIEQSQKSMQKDIKEMKSDVKDLVVTAGDIAIHTGTTADRVTQLEKFTPFKSGAFVA